MRTLILDACKWQTPIDFYVSILPLLEAPYWHGMSMNALIDSIFYGGINGVEPPYRILIRGTANLPENVRTEIALPAEAARDHGGVEKASPCRLIPRRESAIQMGSPPR